MPASCVEPLPKRGDMIPLGRAARHLPFSHSSSRKPPIMGAIGWIWAWLMLLGGVRAHLAQSLPRELIWGMVASGLIALPLLWNRDNGLLGDWAPSGAVRGGIAVFALIAAGISRPDAVMGLI